MRETKGCNKLGVEDAALPKSRENKEGGAFKRRQGGVKVEKKKEHKMKASTCQDGNCAP